MQFLSDFLGCNLKTYPIFKILQILILKIKNVENIIDLTKFNLEN